MITQEYLKSILNYDPLTGILTWVNSSRGGWNGKEAGTPCIGYLRITINKKNYLAHRLAWLYIYGKFPDGILDHIDGDKTNNRINNLREATFSQNVMNQSITSRNSSGAKNVHWCNLTKKWRGTFCIKRKCYTVGFFENIEDAIAAVAAKRLELHGEFARDN